MSHRRARVQLPVLPAQDALAVVDVLQRTIAAIVRAHGEEMRMLREIQRLEANARRHGVTIYDLDVDPDADF